MQGTILYGLQNETKIMENVCDWAKWGVAVPDPELAVSFEGHCTEKLHQHGQGTEALAGGCWSTTSSCLGQAAESRFVCGGCGVQHQAKLAKSPKSLNFCTVQPLYNYGIFS